MISERGIGFIILLVYSVIVLQVQSEEDAESWTKFLVKRNNCAALGNLDAGEDPMKSAIQGIFGTDNRNLQLFTECILKTVLGIIREEGEPWASKEFVEALPPDFKESHGQALLDCLEKGENTPGDRPFKAQTTFVCLRDFTGQGKNYVNLVNNLRKAGAIFLGD